MQHSERYLQTVVTRYALFAGLRLVRHSKPLQRKVLTALYWYQNELSLHESGNTLELAAFEVGHKANWRLGLAVALLHVAAITPGILVCGLIAVIAAPCLLLFWSMWTLALKVFL